MIRFWLMKRYDIIDAIGKDGYESDCSRGVLTTFTNKWTIFTSLPDPIKDGYFQ